MKTPFENYYDTYSEKLKRYVASVLFSRHTEDHDVKDICNQAWINAYRGWDGSRASRPFSWIKTISKNLYIDKFDPNKNLYRRHEICAGDTYERVSLPEIHMIDIPDILQKISDVLPKEMLDVYYLRISGHEVQDIANTMGFSASKVRSLMSRYKGIIDLI